MPLYTKVSFAGRIAALLRGPDREAGLEKERTDELRLRFSGIEGDCHAGLTRKSDSRTLQHYPRNTDIRNVRQVTIVSVEELDLVAKAMDVPAIEPEWLGANMVVSNIPDLTLLPPSTRLQFPSGATLAVDLENGPCRQVAEVIGRHHPEAAMRFVAAATHRRGVTAWVEREGDVRLGDTIVVWLPPQRIYGHGVELLRAAE